MTFLIPHKLSDFTILDNQEKLKRWVQENPKVQIIKDSQTKDHSTSLYPIIYQSQTDQRWVKITSFAQTYCFVDKKLTTKKFEGTACFDPQSRYFGNVYWGHKKIELGVKFGLLTIFRPLHTIVKTIYHLSMLQVIKDLFRFVVLEEYEIELGEGFKHEILDIFRTPFYGACLSIDALAGFILCPFRSDYLYETRGSTDILLRKMWRNKRVDLRTDMSPCMRRRFNIFELGKNPKKSQLEIGKDRFFFFPFLADSISLEDVAKPDFQAKIQGNNFEFVIDGENVQVSFEKMAAYLAFTKVTNKYGDPINPKKTQNTGC